MTGKEKRKLNDFLEDLRVGDIIFELENLKSAILDKELTETEKTGAVLIALAESYEEEGLIKALKNNDMELLNEILGEQLFEAEESKNEAIIARFKACKDEKLVEKTVELIKLIGSDNVRHALELLDDEDLDDEELDSED